jgi:hypothetical protein
MDPAHLANLAPVRKAESLTRKPSAATTEAVANDDQEVMFYQVINFDRQEVFFGVTAQHIEKEIERLAKDRASPAGAWKKGEIVSWRPIADGLKPNEAKVLHRQFEQKTPPNKMKVIKTFKE